MQQIDSKGVEHDARRVEDRTVGSSDGSGSAVSTVSDDGAFAEPTHVDPQLVRSARARMKLDEAAVPVQLLNQFVVRNGRFGLSSPRASPSTPLLLRLHRVVPAALLRFERTFSQGEIGSVNPASLILLGQGSLGDLAPGDGNDPADRTIEPRGRVELPRGSSNFERYFGDEAFGVVSPLPMHVDARWFDDQQEVSIGVEYLERQTRHLGVIPVPRLVINEGGD